MANTFLAARNVRMGRSLVDRESIDVAKRILGDKKVELPVDLVVTDSIDAPLRIEISNVDHGLFDDQMAVDIGPQTIAKFVAAIQRARTIFWNGPMGVFEKEAFATGTMAMARAVAEANATSVVGGGESVEAVKASGFADRISHISTGGGASLEFIAGQKLPGVEVLRVS
jgi:3-phosphoglycerate kinase